MIKDVSLWRSLIEENNASSLNDAIAKGHGRHIISLSETLHEHKYGEMAETIAASKGVKLVLIAGPSSSGKTTSSKRLALHMRVIGLNPVVIGLDDFFKPRELTPRDKNGEYDFECLGALDLDYLNEVLSDLLRGKEVNMPHFDFASGTRRFDGDKYHMNENDVLVMEGIHGLNPALTPGIRREDKFQIFVSVLTPMAIDDETFVSSSDYRLLRRIVRDHQFRGCPAEQTIIRWPSVRLGEARNILPFKGEADCMFNSALMYELAVLKSYAEPLLQVIAKDSVARHEAERLLDILHRIIALTPVDSNSIPPVSIIREFLGGSCFKY